MILVIGDVHGDFDALNAFLAQTPAHTVLVCGDFGFWPSYGKHVASIRNAAQGRKITLRFCDGNHEEHPRLRELIRPDAPFATVEVAVGIFYQPRGSLWTTPHGVRVFFAGGAYSTDCALRTAGDDWFPQLELLRREDLPLVLPAMDVVISHTAPAAFPMRRQGIGQHLPQSGSPDPSRDVLDTVLREGKPSRWFFGHFHEAKKGETEGCRWQCLPPCHDDRPLHIKNAGIPRPIQAARLE